MADPFIFTPPPTPLAPCFFLSLMPCKVPHVGPFCGVTDPCSESAIFPGDPAVIYNIGLTVRGVFETKVYTGGTQSGGGRFQIGGTPSLSLDNMPRLKVSNPAQSYYMNRLIVAGPSVVVALCYSVTIPIRGGAIVTMDCLSFDNGQLQNAFNVVVPHACSALPDITFPVQPYDGQFIRLDFDCSAFLPLP